MKCIFYIFIWLVCFPLSVFSQEKTTNEFYINDPAIYKKGQLLISTSYLKKTLFNDGVAIVSILDTLSIPVKNKKGIINTKGKFLVDPKYLTVERSDFGIIALQNESKEWEFFTKSGYVNTSGHFDSYRIISAYQIMIEDRGRWGMLVLNKNNHVVIEPTYKSIEKLHDDNFKFTHFNNWTLVNTAKVTLNTFLYDSLSFYSDSLLKYQLNEFSGLINYQGKIVHENISLKPNVEQPKTSSIDRSELMRRVELGKHLKTKSKIKKNIISDSSGKKIAIEYDSIIGPYENVYVLYKNGQIGIVDDQGIVLSDYSNRFEKVFPYKDDRAKIIKNGKYGFIDLRGNVRVAPQYLKVKDFNEGLAAVLINEKWGFVDKDENIIIQPLYSEVADFKNGLARVKSNGKWYLVNKQDKKLGSGYDAIQIDSTQNWKLIKGNKIGLASVEGKELLAPRYEFVKDLNNGMVIVKKADKWGVVDYSENFVFPIEYDFTSFSNGLFLFMKKGKVEEKILKSDLQK
jgi:hypothetical protein